MMNSLPKFRLPAPSVKPKLLEQHRYFQLLSPGKVMNGLTSKRRSKRRPPLSALFPRIGITPTCDREDFVPTVVNFGPWAYLEFRPYRVFHDKFFPPLSDIASLLADTSLLDLGLGSCWFGMLEHCGWK